MVYEERAQEPVKGIDRRRINLAVSPENYRYVQIMSRLRGQSMTMFINDCLEYHRGRHGSAYQQATKLFDGVERDNGPDGETH